MLAPSVGRAQDVTTEEAPAEAATTVPDWYYLELRLQDVRDRRDPTFARYRDVSGGLVLHDLQFELDGRVTFHGTSLGRADQRLELEARRQGRYRVRWSSERTPHVFAFDVATLYANEGPGVLVLDDAVQGALQSSPDAATTAGLLEGFVAAASRRDVSLTRRRDRVSYERPRGLGRSSVELVRERRSGFRPSSGGLSFTSVQALLAPIAYETRDVRLRQDYVRRGTVASASLQVGEFSNDVGGLRWDDPFVVGRTGAMALPPDNEFDNVALSVAKTDLPRHGRVSLAVSRGATRQNESLLPYTSNVGLAGPFELSDPANLPAASAAASVVRRSYKAEYAARPWRRVGVRAGLDRYEHDNESPVLTFPGYVSLDSSWRDGPISNHPLSLQRERRYLDLSLRMDPRSDLSLGYRVKDTERRVREVAEEGEDTLEFALSTRPSGRWSLRLAGTATDRDGDYDYRAPFEDLAGNPSVLPWLRKYDVANVHRRRLLLESTHEIPRPAMTVHGTVERSTEDYDESLFGLLEDDVTSYGLDLDCTLGERLNGLLYFHREIRSNMQGARQWNPGSTGDPYVSETTPDSPGNWTADGEDVTSVVGLDLRYTFDPRRRVSAELSFSRSVSDGLLAFRTPSGTGSPDLNDFLPLAFDEVDDSTLHGLSMKVNFGLGSTRTLSVGYLREHLHLSDYDYDYMTEVPVTLGGGYAGVLAMGVAPRAYEVSVVYLQYTVQF